jgi:hypothetical protein
MNDDLIQPKYMVCFYFGFGVVSFFVLWMIFRGIRSLFK